MGRVEEAVDHVGVSRERGAILTGDRLGRRDGHKSKLR
jgi:hypothetical protein